MPVEVPLNVADDVNAPAPPTTPLAAARRALSLLVMLLYELRASPPVPLSEIKPSEALVPVGLANRIPVAALP
jgi:hypothetical protein